MAKKINRHQPAKPQPTEAEVNELEILHPERELTLGGKKVIVREYSNIEWLRLLGVAEPLVAKIAEVILSDAKNKVLDFEDILLFISDHLEQMLPMILQSADMDVKEFDALDYIDVESLLLTWFGVNYHFFIQRAQTRASLQVKASQSASGESTQP